MTAHSTDLAALPVAARKKVLLALDETKLRRLQHNWRFWARAAQLAPTHRSWIVWLVLAGRGFGKTRTGAEWVREQVKAGYKIIHLIAPTASDLRKVMVEGPAGILAVCTEEDVTDAGEAMGRPVYEPSKTKITWANGAVAHLFSAEEPERLRGPQAEKIWADELAAWQNAADTWDMAMFGLRLGKEPQACVTTTPKPIPIVRELVKDPTTVITGGSTYENRANLAPTFFDKIVRKYEGTRLGRQELNAEILDEAEGALWSRDMIRNLPAPADMKAYAKTLARVVVAVDPPIKSNGESALCGIVVSGVDFKGRGKVLADWSGRMKPFQWGSKVVQAYDEFTADRIIAEGNQGGEMVSYTIETVRKGLPVSLVFADRSKQARAEPVSALYEKGLVDHVGAFPELEDELCVWEPLGGQPSPNRLDALVWGVTHLQIGLGGNVVTTAEERFIIEPDQAFKQGRIPSTWRRAMAIDLDSARFAAAWMTYDPVTDTIYLYDEFEAPRGELPSAIAGVKAKGSWIPALFDTKAHKRQEAAGVKIAEHINELGVDVSIVEVDMEAAMEGMTDRLTTGRMRVFSTMTHWLQALRGLRRDDEGQIVEENIHLIRAAALLVTYGMEVAITEYRASSDREGFDQAEFQRGKSPTGY